MTVSITDAQMVNAVHRIATMREQHPELGRTETAARNVIVARIILMDEAMDREQSEIDAGLQHRHHSLQEQADVLDALHTYLGHLVNLVRGEVSENEESNG